MPMLLILAENTPTSSSSVETLKLVCACRATDFYCEHTSQNALYALSTHTSNKGIPDTLMGYGSVPRKKRGNV